MPITIEEDCECGPIDQEHGQQGDQPAYFGTLEVDPNLGQEQPESVVETDQEQDEQQDSVLEKQSKSLSFLKRFENWLNI